MPSVPYDSLQIAALTKPCNGVCNAGRFARTVEAGEILERCTLKHGHPGDCNWPSRAEAALMNCSDDQLHAEYERRFGGKPPVEKYREACEERERLAFVLARESKTMFDLVKDFNCPTGPIYPWLRSELTELSALRREKAKAFNPRIYVTYRKNLSTEEQWSEIERHAANVQRTVFAETSGVDSLTRGESGPGIAAKPAPRPDNSVAFLDEELLCADID